MNNASAATGQDLDAAYPRKRTNRIGNPGRGDRPVSRRYPRQIDEPALREGVPLVMSEWLAYLARAGRMFPSRVPEVAADAST